MNEAIREQLSAYVDGELPENEAELLIRRMSQDADLRKDVAEYLSIGRVIRDEMGVAAADRLHERVAAEIDDRDVVDEIASVPSPVARSLKPLAGVAIAASVALLAIFSLQNTGVDVDQPDVPAVVETAVPSVTSQQEMQREMLLKHANATSDLGANGMNSRLVTLEFDEPDDLDTEQETPDATESDDLP